MCHSPPAMRSKRDSLACYAEGAASASLPLLLSPLLLLGCCCWDAPMGLCYCQKAAVTGLLPSSPLLPESCRHRSSPLFAPTIAADCSGLLCTTLGCSTLLHGYGAAGNRRAAYVACWAAGQQSGCLRGLLATGQATGQLGCLQAAWAACVAARQLRRLCGCSADLQPPLLHALCLLSRLSSMPVAGMLRSALSPYTVLPHTYCRSRRRR